MTNWLITGAATDLGRAIAEEVLRRGDHALLTGLDVAPLEDLVATYPQTAITTSLDVTDPDQRHAALEAAESIGGVDILVNNTAIDYVGAIEEQTDEAIRAQFEVNFFGALPLTRLVLPGMRARKRGTIVNVSSMDGVASLPGNGIYSSTKFAIEGLTEALWQELEPIGLRALLVEPGSFRTGIEGRTKASGEPISDYADTAGAFRGMLANLSPEMFPGDPARAAAVIYDTVATDTDRHWLVLDTDAQRRIRVKLDACEAELASGTEIGASTDFPGSGPAVI